MKKHFKQVFFTLALAIIGFSFSGTSAQAGVCTSGTFDSSGGWIFTIGTETTCTPPVYTGHTVYTDPSWRDQLVLNPYGLPEGSVLGIFQNILSWLLGIFAVLGIIGFVISGIFYLVSAGDEGMIDKAKAGMKWSIVGIIVGLSGWIIMTTVDMLLAGGASSGL